MCGGRGATKSLLNRARGGGQSHSPHPLANQTKKNIVTTHQNNIMQPTRSATSATFLCCFIAAAIISTASAQQLLEGIYCGKENCYDVLQVTRESTRSEIAKSYRLLARKYHPDLHRDPVAKAEAGEQFKVVANAYEILKDEESRIDYDYMLDNPQEYYAHYYRYYRRRVAPKVDVRLVLIVTISIISLIQYFSAKQRYEDAIKYFLTVPKYRNKALELINASSAKASTTTGGKKERGSKNKLSKAEQKEEQEQTIRRIIMENMDIKGSYAKPSVCDVLWIQLLISPYTIAKYFLWYGSWVWKFTIMSQPYGDEEKLYLIRKQLGMGVHQFNGIEEDTKQSYVEMELWIKDNFKAWKREQEEEMKLKMAENPRYKQYRRYMKNHGPGRMTFED